MKLTLNSFLGAIPRLLPEQLPLQAAAKSENSLVEDGLCTPLNDFGSDLGVALAVGTKSIYHYPHGAGYWLSFNDDADVVLSPVSGNNEGRVYWTRPSTVPQMSVIDVIATAAPYPSASYDLGIPRPTTAPSGTINGAVNSDTLDADRITLLYVYTYVSAYGEESQQSVNSEPLVVAPEQSVTLSVPGTGPGGNRNIETKRIYRDDGGQGYKFLAEIPVATTTYEDAADPYTVQGAELETWEWDPPPANLRGLTDLGAGVIAGFVGNEVFLCEPFRPHTFPSIYKQRFTHDVVGLAGFSQGAIVMTKKKTFLLVGYDPLSMQQIPVDLVEPCVSKRSIVDAGEYVIYAGPRGLSVVGVSGGKLVTKQILKASQWQALKPESIHAYLWDKWYVGFYDTGTTQGSFMVPIDTMDHIAYSDQYVQAAHIEPGSPDLTVAKDDALRHWSKGAPLTQTRHTKVFEYETEVSVSVLRVRAQSYDNLTVAVWVDGALHDTILVLDDSVHTMALVRGRSYQLRIETTDIVRVVEIASNHEELGA